MTSEPEAQYPAPRAGTLRNLRVQLSVPPQGTRTFTLRVNAANTAMTCAIGGPSAQSCSSSASHAVTAGDLLSLSESTSKSAAAVATFSFELAPN